MWLWAEGECLGLGSAFIGVKDGGLGFLRLTLFVNLKHKEWKFKAWEEREEKKRNSSLNGLLTKATEISKTKKVRSLKYREDLHLSYG